MHTSDWSKITRTKFSTTKKRQSQKDGEDKRTLNMRRMKRTHRNMGLSLKMSRRIKKVNSTTRYRKNTKAIWMRQTRKHKNT
eukprot:15631380-Heterocapsa_arctica.AAC.1